MARIGSIFGTRKRKICCCNGWGPAVTRAVRKALFSLFKARVFSEKVNIFHPFCNDYQIADQVVVLIALEFHSDVAKHSNILKKQCELYAILGQLDSCVAKANILLQSNDKEVTKFVARVLAPFLSQLDFQTLQVVSIYRTL